MTDLAVRDENNTPAVNGSLAAPAYAPSPLVQWAYEARQASQIADSLAKTSFVPASLRGKPADVTAAILAGQELGLQPMASLRSMDVIQGTPALRAHAMRGLVQSKGHSIQLIESTDRVCRMRGRRKGEGDDAWQEVEWTIEQAAALGLLSKDQWKKQPKNMLVARCTGAICRLVAADVLYAMPYASEELGDDGAEQPAGPVRAAARVTTSEILGNAAAARTGVVAARSVPEVMPSAVEAQRPVSAPPAEPTADAFPDSEDVEWPETAKPAGGAA